MHVCNNQNNQVQVNHHHYQQQQCTIQSSFSLSCVDPSRLHQQRTAPPARDSHCCVLCQTLHIHHTIAMGDSQVGSVAHHPLSAHNTHHHSTLKQYSFSLTTFSPSGKLVQIEYALNAVNAGATALGIKATNGVVLATEKKLPSILIDDTTVQKISTITPNVGMAYAGMGPDSRVLVRKARKEAQAYYRLYHEHIPVAQLVRETAAVMQEFTRMWRVGGRCT